MPRPGRLPTRRRQLLRQRVRAGMCCTVNVVSAPPTPLGVGGDHPRARIFDLIYRSCFSCLEKVLIAGEYSSSLIICYCCLKLNQEVRMHLFGLPPFTVSYLSCHWTSKTVSWNHDSCPLKNEMPREILSQRNESSNHNFDWMLVTSNV